MIFYFFLLIYLLVFSFIAWKNIPLAIAVLMALLPTYLIRFNLWFFPTTLLEAMLLITIIAWFIKFGFKKIISRRNDETPYVPYPFKGQIILIILAATLAVFVSANSWKALGLWRAYFLEPILFFLIFLNVIDTKKKTERIFFALGLSAIIISFIAIWQKFFPLGINLFGQFFWPIANPYWQEKANRRVTSFFEYPNAVGLFLGPLALLFCGWFLAERKKIWLRIFQILAIFLSIIAIFFARSEAALLGLIFVIILGGLLLNKKIRRITGLIIIILIIFSLSTPLKNYLSEKLLLRDFSGQIRIQIWKETSAMLKDKPLFGAGLSSYQQVIAPYHQSGIKINGKFQPVEIYLYPHNIFLNFWSELGLLGLIGFLWLIYVYLWQAMKLWQNSKNHYPKTMSLALLLIMLLIIINGLVDVPYFKNDLAIIFWFFCGVLIILKRLDNSKNESL